MIKKTKHEEYIEDLKERGVFDNEENEMHWTPESLLNFLNNRDYKSQESLDL